MSATKTMKIGLSNADKTTMKNQVYASAIATLITPYSSASTYAVGDFCSKDGNVYKCTTAISTAEAWNSAHWTSATLNDIVDAVNQAVNTVNGKANVDGNYPTMTVGLADNLNSKIMQNDVDNYNFRTAGGSKEIGNICKENAIVGGSLGFNQLVNVNFADGTGMSANGTKSVSNGVITATSSNGINRLGLNTGVTMETNHKFLIMAKLQTTCGFSVDIAGQMGLRTFYQALESFTDVNIIFDYDKEAGSRTIYIYHDEAFTDDSQTISCSKLQFYDLTGIFGKRIADYIYALEQAEAGTGVAWFRRYLKKQVYPYTALGALQHVITRGKKVIGFNHLDLANWHTNAKARVTSYEANSHDITMITNGEGTDTYIGDVSARTADATKELLIEVEPNTAYTLSLTTPSNVTDVLCWAPYFGWYDANSNFITNQSLDFGASASQRKSVTKTSPANAKYLVVRFGVVQTTASVQTYTFKDVCLHYHYDGERDGEFEEYASITTECDEVALKGIFDIDEEGNLICDGDRYNSDGTVDEEYGEVDLGDLNWQYQTPPEGYDYNPYFFVNKSDIKLPDSQNTSPDFACAIYEVISHNGALWTTVDKVITCNTDPYIEVVDSSYNDASAFKTAMAGKKLIYKKATATQSSHTAFPLVQAVDNWGSEKYLEPLNDTRPCEVPVGHDTDYPLDCKSKLEIMPDLPSSDGMYVCKVDSGTAQYVSLPAYLSDNNYKQVQDLTSSLVKNADLYTTNKRLYKIGNIVFLSLDCANISGSDIANGTKLFTLPSGAFGSGFDMNFPIVTPDKGCCYINTSGEISIDKTIVNSGRFDLHICFAIA